MGFVWSFDACILIILIMIRYHFGYSRSNMNWEEVMNKSTNVIVYNDMILDDIMLNRPRIDFNHQSPTSSIESNDTQHTDNQQIEYNNQSMIEESRLYYIISNEKTFNPDVKYMPESLSNQDIETIILSNSIVYIKGFLFLRRKKSLLNQMVNSACDNDFNEISAKLGLDTWRYEFYHKKFLFNKMNKLINKTTIKKLYEINREHPLITFFQEFLRSCFKVITNRVFSIIIIGNTKIGKSICFKECLVDSKYIEYHNNMLEFSKCVDENKKLFRLMDDINWNTVDVMTLKSILNRNVSSVDVKYSYGIIYPMINIFLMNKEDYVIFQRKYVDIWSFISNNVSIYPKQTGEDVLEETEELYDPRKPFSKLLFDDIIPIGEYEEMFNREINRGDYPNIYERVKSFLITNEPYLYDNKQFIDITSIDINFLPNRQLLVNEMNQKIKEIETKEKYERTVIDKDDESSKDIDGSTVSNRLDYINMRRKSKKRGRRLEKKPIKDEKMYNKKGYLDYYFNKHKKRNKYQVHDNNYINSSPTGMYTRTTKDTTDIDNGMDDETDDMDNIDGDLLNDPFNETDDENNMDMDDNDNDIDNDSFTV